MPQITTYHCLCHTTLLATTYTLTALPRRSSTLDKAYILPCPRLRRRRSRRSRNSPNHHDSNTNGEEDTTNNEDDLNSDEHNSQDSSSSESNDDQDQDEEEPVANDDGSSVNHLTTLSSLSLHPTPTLVRLDTGIEKRYTVSCTRCSLVVGYRLDWLQFQQAASGNSNDESRNRQKKGRRDDVLYILPGAVVSTEEMVRGERPRMEEVRVGGVS